jgi:hypothetical protein
MTPADGENHTPAAAALANARALVSRLLTIAFLALLAAAVAGLTLRYAEIGRDGRRSAENLADVLSEYLGIRLAMVDGVLFRVVGNSRRIGGPAASEREWSTALRTATSGVPGVSSIVITDADGIVTYSTVLTIVGQSWAERPIFQKLRDGRPNLLIADAPFVVGAGNERLIPFGRALTDARGKFIGTAVATLVPGQLEDFYSAFDLGESGVAWVLLRSGVVLFRAGAAADLENAAELPALAAGRAAPPEGFISGPLAQGGPDYLTAYRKSRITDLVAAVSLPKAELLSRWRYEAVAVAVLILAAGLFLFFARRLIDRAMTDAVEAAGADGKSPDET